MNIENGIYRLRAVWVDTEGETRVHYDRHLCENYEDLKRWKDKTKEMIEGHGGVVKSITIDECEAFKLENWIPL